MNSKPNKSAQHPDLRHKTNGFLPPAVSAAVTGGLLIETGLYLESYLFLSNARARFSVNTSLIV